jgi:hypothetical protein
MKIRHFKRRARRPDFRLTRFRDMTLAEVKSYAAVARFFGETTPDEDERAMRFFGVEANR